VAVLKQATYVPPTFPQVWGANAPRPGSRVPVLPPQVRVDTSTSDRFTILDIFASDRRGLLYAITRRLFELRLSVHRAKIGTRMAQVVDVFYVTAWDGQKVVDAATLEEIRRRLLEEILQNLAI